MSNPEEMLLQSAGVVVTTHRAEIQGTTYAIANVTSVGVRVHNASVAGPLFLVLVGMVVGIGGFRSPPWGTIGLLGMVAGVIAIVVSRGQHALVLVTAGAERPALVSRNRASLEVIASAITTAIVRR